MVEVCTLSFDPQFLVLPSLLSSSNQWHLNCPQDSEKVGQKCAACQFHRVVVVVASAQRRKCPHRLLLHPRSCTILHDGPPMPPMLLLLLHSQWREAASYAALLALASCSAAAAC